MAAFLTFLREIARGDIDAVKQRLAADPTLANKSSPTGATRQSPTNFFLREINHYLYAGDTALHIAAAAFQPRIARLLVKHGADIHAKNRRGAQPLHYAADTNHWNPKAQSQIIQFLAKSGADPNATDNSGVTPLHRAVRTRSAPAVRALLIAGANPNQPNKSGSTPLKLATQTTGRGGSGTPPAREQQQQIIQLLLEHGAHPR